MRTVARVIAVFLGLLFIGGALFLLAINYNLFPGLGVIVPDWADEVVLLATGSVLLLLALILLALGLRKKGSRESNAVLKGSEYGEVLISINALENMVLRVVQQTQGIKDVSRQVNYTPEGLVVKVKIRVMPDLPMPDLIKDLQAKTKEYLEDISGIVVHEVKVVVENIIVDQPSSVTKK
jgi:uncharacterized alkaline shock family protein YloU